MRYFLSSDGKAPYLVRCRLGAYPEGWIGFEEPSDKVPRCFARRGVARKGEFSAENGLQRGNIGISLERVAAEEQRVHEKAHAPQVDGRAVALSLVMTAADHLGRKIIMGTAD